MLKLDKILSLEFNMGDKIIYKVEDENKKENIVYVEKQGHVVGIYDRFIQVSNGIYETAIMKVDFFLDLARKG